MEISICDNFYSKNTKAIALNGMQDKYGYETTGLGY